MTPARIAFGFAYPFLVFGALTWFHARGVALVLGAALTIRALVERRRPGTQHLDRALPAVALVGSVAVLALVFNDGRVFLYVPSLVNAALLIAFGRTLWNGPSMVEGVARWQGYELSPEKVRYCRRVTIAWCGFFLVNGTLILWLALHASLAQWTLYTGVIAYVLVGLLLALELLYRAWRFRDYRDSPLDAILRRLFPPPERSR